MMSTQSSDPIKVTQSAIAKVYELMQGENNLNLKLRVYITGGGCSGFQYGFSFEESVNSDDIVIQKHLTGFMENASDTKIPVIEGPSICLLVDAMSLQYLQGAEIDYLKNLQGEQFIIRNNPKAKTTCGCGSSFAIQEEE